MGEKLYMYKKLVIAQTRINEIMLSRPLVHIVQAKLGQADALDNETKLA